MLNAQVGIAAAVVSPAAILRLLGEWALPAMQQCVLFHVGQNDTYRVTASGRVFAARLYRAGWRSDDDVTGELELLEHLHARGVPTSPPIRTSDDRLFSGVSAPDGYRQLALFGWASGGGPSLADFPAEDYGSVLARIHKEADDFVPSASRFDFDVERLIDQPLAAALPHLAAVGLDERRVAEIGAQLRAEIGQLGVGLDVGWCHNDLIGNVVHDGSSMTVLDFDGCGRGWHSHELSTVLLQFAAWARHPERVWQRFVDGYRSVRMISDADVAAARTFVPVRYLELMGLHAQIGDWLGHRRDSEWLIRQAGELLRWSDPDYAPW